MIKDVFLKRKKKHYLRHTDCFSCCRESSKKNKTKSEFSIEKCFSLVMNHCKLVFRQQYRCENNRTTKRKPQNTARQNDRLRWHSNAKQFEKYMKIKKLGYYCFFSESCFKHICLPRHVIPWRGEPALSNDPFVCNTTCLDIARILCRVLLFSRVDAAFPGNLTKDARTSPAPLASITMLACTSHAV